MSTYSLVDLAGYYSKLLIFQYRTKPKAVATINLYAKQAIFDDIFSQIRDAYNISTAVGPQLDVLGKYIGLPRNIGDPASAPYFGFRSYVTTDPQNSNGFRSYLSTDNQFGVWASYSNPSVNTDLTDSQYQFMLILKIILNSNDGTLYSIMNYLNTFLPGFVSLVDNCNMTMTYTIIGQPPVSVDVLAAYLPKPMGVGLIVNFETVRVLMDGSTERTLEDGTTLRITS